jgi:hypothetical protein
MKQYAYVALMACALAPLCVRAATVTETDPFSIDTTTGPGAPSSVNLTFGQFNSSLGTLTGVSVQLSGTADSVLAFINSSPTSTPFTNGESTTSLSLSGTGLSTLSTGTLDSGLVASGTINGSPTSTAASPVFAYTYFAGPHSAANLSGSVAAGSLGSYIGSGSMMLSGDVFTTAFAASSSMASFAPAASPYFTGVGGGGQASGNVLVTFTYTPVPLPAAFPLLLSGVAAFGALARRRRLSPA